MSRSLEFVEKRAEDENEAQEEPNAYKNRSDDKISKIAALDNGTLVESFKFLNYSQLAKNSFVSTKFWNLIRNNRHRLELLRVDVIQMRMCPANDASIKVFKKQLSPEEYNEWVILNQHSKQIPLEVQDAEIPSTQHDSKMYELTAKGPYKEQNLRQWDGSELNYRQWRDSLDTTVFHARTKLDHENWPLFQHFVRLLTDPFIFIRFVGLVNQTEVLNLLASAINTDRNCLRCETLVFYLEGDDQKFIGWIKKHVVCKKIGICNKRDSNNNVDDDSDEADADSDTT
ncbi:hypothetical protein Ddc_17013 [Ditylenchus destructor]|nr:hypothetical protein Ddc_17013 [Ditylenchus destructor]